MTNVQPGTFKRLWVCFTIFQRKIFLMSSLVPETSEMYEIATYKAKYHKENKKDYQEIFNGKV